MTHPLTLREKVARAALRAEMNHSPGVWDTEPEEWSVEALEMHGYFAIADAILTALASGSGDHAELARLAEEATAGPWNYEGVGYADDGGQFREVTSSAEIIFGEYGCVSEENAAFIAAANPATVLALLAENAALRDECDGMVEEVSRSQARLHAATEAERKLDEAEETSTRWAIRFAELRKAAGIGVKPMLSEVPGELRKMRSLIDRAADLMRQCTDPDRFERASTLNVYANMRAWLSDLSKEAERG